MLTRRAVSRYQEHARRPGSRKNAGTTGSAAGRQRHAARRRRQRHAGRRYSNNSLAERRGGLTPISSQARRPGAEEAGGGIDRVVAQRELRAPGPKIEQLELARTTALNGTGNELGDLLFGNAAADQPGVRLAGNDSITGMQGDGRAGRAGSSNNTLDGGSPATMCVSLRSAVDVFVEAVGDQQRPRPRRGGVRRSAPIENLTLIGTASPSPTHGDVAGRRHPRRCQRRSASAAATANDLLAGGRGDRRRSSASTKQQLYGDSRRRLPYFIDGANSGARWIDRPVDGRESRADLCRPRRNFLVLVLTGDGVRRHRRCPGRYHQRQCGGRPAGRGDGADTISRRAASGKQLSGAEAGVVRSGAGTDAFRFSCGRVRAPMS